MPDYSNDAHTNNSKEYIGGGGGQKLPPIENCITSCSSTVDDVVVQVNGTTSFRYDDPGALPDVIMTSSSSPVPPISSSEATDPAIGAPDEAAVVIVLNDVKTEFYEIAISNFQFVVLRLLQLRQVLPQSLQVNFDPKSITVSFISEDNKLLGEYSAASGTRFVWKAELAEEIVPEESGFRVHGLIELKLKKRVEKVRWSSPLAVARVAPVKQKVVKSDCKQKDVELVETDFKNSLPSTSSSSASPFSPSPPSADHQNGLSSSLIPIPPPPPGSLLTSSPSAAIPLPPPPLATTTTSSSSNSSCTDQKKGILSSSSQKPTATVTPYNPYQSEGLTVKLGYMGLKNVGNTCFMNSVVQVLLNTNELVMYFHDNRAVRRDLNVANPLGLGGHLAEKFYSLMHAAWEGKTAVYDPSALKEVVAKRATQFSNFAQHDAQEFLSFLLDGLHEDLNRVREKPITCVVESDGRPDAVVAEEAWETHKQRNDSIVVDLFHGQFRSRLQCPHCSKVSITFDPFVYIAVPFPPEKRRLIIYFFAASAAAKPKKLGIVIHSSSQVADLLKKIGERVNVPWERLLMVEMFQHKVWKVFDRPHQEDLSIIRDVDILFVFELLDPTEAGEPIANLLVIQRLLISSDRALPDRCVHCRSRDNLKACAKCYAVGYCSRDCQQNDWHRHKLACIRNVQVVGLPFLVSLPRSKMTPSRLYQYCGLRCQWSVNVFQLPRSRSGSLSDKIDLNELDDGSLDSCDLIQPSASPPLTVNRSETFENVIASFGNNNTAVAAVGEEDNNSTGSILPTPSDSLPLLSPSVKTQPTVRLVLSEENCSGGKRAALFKQELFRFALCNKSGECVEDKVKNRWKKLTENEMAAIELDGCEFLAMDWINRIYNKEILTVENKNAASDSSLRNSSTNLGLDCVDETLNDPELLSEEMRGRELSVYDLLDRFTEEEVLDPQEAWYCDRCKTHRQAFKQLSLWRVPALLVIQLKRFQYSPAVYGSFNYGFGSRSKIDRPVTYPVSALDLNKYLCSTALEQHINESTVYDLYGVVQHNGSSYFGHYISFARCARPELSTESTFPWRRFDDRIVRSLADANQAVTPDAYLLFYKRRGAFVSNLFSELQVLNSSDVEDDDDDFEDGGANMSGGGEVEVYGGGEMVDDNSANNSFQESEFRDAIEGDDAANMALLGDELYD